MKAKNKKLTYSATILALAALSTESAFAACTPGGTAATS